MIGRLWFELIFSGTTVLALVIYHWILAWKVRHHPMETAIGITNHVRRVWVQSVMKNHTDILAIQTLRNNVMAATFLASTAMLISLGLLNATFKPGIFNEVSHTLNLFGMKSEVLWMVKLLVLTLVFFFSFFNFTLAIRYFNHAGFMLTLPHGDRAGGTDPDSVAAVMNHGALHYTLGMRGFYLAAPLGLWLFGPIWMLFGTLIMLMVIYRLDRTP
nr:DUF599 domain-containing protein [uncultured Desulfobacter sp.]